MNRFDKVLKRAFSAMQQTGGETRQFVISDGAGGVEVFNANVVWSRDTLKHNIVIGSEGAFMAEAVVTFDENDLPRRPMPGEYIESPRYSKWEILDVIGEPGTGIVELALTRRGIL